CHEGQFVVSGDAASRWFGNVASRIKAPAFLRYSFLQRRHDRSGGEVLIRAIVPSGVQSAPTFHRTPNRVCYDGDCGIASLAHVTNARNLLRLLIVEVRNLASNDRTAG